MLTDSLNNSGTAHTSLFEGHLLQAENLNPILHPLNYQYGITWLIVACFAAIVWVFTTDRKKMKLLFSATTSIRNVEQLIRNEYALSNRLSIVLSIIFLITTGLFIYQSNHYFNWINPEKIQSKNFVFLKIFSGLILFYFIKLILIQTAGLIFERKQETFAHIFTTFLFNEVAGLIIFPLTTIALFSSKEIALALIYSIAAILLGFYLFKILRLLITGMANRDISLIHLFLYLCTLEILPLVVVIKLFVSRI